MTFEDSAPKGHLRIPNPTPPHFPSESRPSPCEGEGKNEKLCVTGCDQFD